MQSDIYILKLCSIPTLPIFIILTPWFTLKLKDFLDFLSNSKKSWRVFFQAFQMTLNFIKSNHLVMLGSFIFMFLIYLFQICNCKFHGKVHFVSCISWLNSHFPDLIYCMPDPPWIIADANTLSSLSCFSYLSLYHLKTWTCLFVGQYLQPECPSQLRPFHDGGDENWPLWIRSFISSWCSVTNKIARVHFVPAASEQRNELNFWKRDFFF